MSSYSHSFGADVTTARYRLMWPVLLADTQKILLAVGQLGIGMCGPDGFGVPVLDSHAGIAVNGDAATGRQGTPLLLPPPLIHGQRVPPRTGTCHTRRERYDLAVTAVLLRAWQLLGDDFAVRSSGRWDVEWNEGPRLGLPGARQLITDLFGEVPRCSPL
ncbi:hypothetical protein QEZ54_08440 [Catellatospora sp. KI3]|uniref:hypothetical protein n=1 Tax=Catellatospora sp. KI3 TaxID=3041620 RepID=UPI002482F3BB|nr:hypothetical protein [Catellatospora sp. KI3]MDI1460989.1 hypothetical protein [Catellatospora sp. KI3]